MPITDLAIAGSRGHIAATLAELAGLPQLRVTALHPACDAVEPLTSWCRANHHTPRLFGEYEVMLDAARPHAVVVCGPFESHAPMCVAAVRRGIHVLTEKPACITVPQLDLLRRTCEANPAVHVAGMLSSRYAPGFMTARRLILDGAIGPVRLINTRKSYKLGNRPPYYHHRDTYGGTIPWVGSHAVDWILHLTDNLPFTSVYAAHSADHNGDNGTMERSALCHFTLTGDVFASVSIDYLRPSAAPTHGDDWARVVGTTGVLEIRPDALTLTTDTAGPADVPVTSDRTLLQDFVRHIDTGVPALLTTQSTLALTDACLRALKSADERRVIPFGQ
jgi:predicted dehydrogenase